MSSNYVNRTVQITIEKFGYRTDIDLKRAVIEALRKDLLDEHDAEIYINADDVKVKVKLNKKGG